MFRELSFHTAIDANINRALEGLRVCEDVWRFVFKDDKISFQLKNIRHQVATQSRIFSSDLLINSRDIKNDKLKFLDIYSEMRRDSVSDIIKSNIHRAIEAVRSLEEFSKVAVKDTDNIFQEIRFSLYELEKVMFLKLNKNNRISRFKNSLYAILDPAFVPCDKMQDSAIRLIKGGVSIIQLRMKNFPIKKIYDLSKEISLICREHDIMYIVNDFPDIAILTEAGGVHLGQDDLPLDAARRLILDDMIIGISTHSIEEADMALINNPDYIAIGPVFDTKSKYGEMIKGIGTDIAGSLRMKTDIPIVCIGGINSNNIAGLKAAGCSCFAVLSHLYNENKIEDNCKRLLDAINSRKSDGME